MSVKSLQDVTLVVQNAGVQVGIQIFSKVLGTVVFILLAGVLGPNTLGMYVANLSYCQLVLTIAMMGMPGVIQREIARDPQEARAFVRSAVSLRLPLLLACFPLAIFGADLLGQDDESRHVMLLVFLAETIMGFTNITCAFFQARQKSHLEGLVRLMHILPFLVGVIVVLKADGGLIQVLWVSVGANVLALALAVLLLYSITPGLGFSLRPDFRGAAQLMRKGSSFFLIGLVSNWNTLGSVLLVRYLISTEAAGTYAASEKLVLAFLFLIPSASNAVIPALAKKVKADPEAMHRLLGYSLKYLTMLGLPIGASALMLSDQIVDFVYGAKYAGAGPVLAILGVSVALAFANHTFIMGLIATRRERSVVLIVCVNVVAHLIPAVLLAESLGIVGMAWAVLIRHVWSIGFTLWVCRDIARGLPSWTVPKLAGVLGAGLAMALVGALLGGQHVVIALGAASLVYVAGLRLFRVIDSVELGYFRASLSALKR